MRRSLHVWTVANGIRVKNLGYSASVTLDIPVWDWLATEHKVKQSEIRRDVAKVALTRPSGG